jgi:[protein-PII] uridylyltransferase
MLADGLVEVTPDRTLAAEPSLGLRTVASAAQRSVRLGRATTERLRRELTVRDELAWDEAGRTALLATLGQGSRMLGAVRDADHIGLLAAHLPEWTRVRGRPQRNPFHRFDLDTHSLQAVCELVAIAEGGDGAARAELFAGLDDPGILLLGTMLHDVGKAWPGDHSTVGADVGRRWVEHMGFSSERADVVSQLIRHHLLLPDVATRRDIDDPAEVAAVARAVGDVELLDGLLLLTLADSRATGPSAHSPWKDGLIAELHGRVRGVLAEDASALSSAFDPEVAVAAARAVASTSEEGADPAAVEHLLAGIDDRYVLAASPEQCRLHAELIDPPPGVREIRARWHPGPAAGTATLDVVGRDRLGFMADCAGVLAGHGLAVLDARAFTRAGRDGPDLAIDWFVVTAGEDLDSAAVVGDLERVAAGEVDVTALIARREARRDVRPPVLAEPLRVSVDIDEQPEVTRIEVSGPAAPGALSRLAAVLSAAGLGVIGARVTTLGPEVRDVFFLRTPAEPPEGGWSGVEDRLRAAAGWPDRVVEARPV